MSILGRIFLISLALNTLTANAQFNPRFQPQFAPPPAFQHPSFQRGMSAFAELNGFGVPQMPSFAPSSNMNRYASYGQAPYGSPLFGVPNQSQAPFSSANQLQMNEPPLMEQQMFVNGFGQPLNSQSMNNQPTGRRPSFAQFGQFSQMASHFNGGLPPAFPGLPASYGGSNPVGGRSPFQRVAGQEMGSGSSNFNELEPFQQLPTDSTETKEKRSIKTE